MLNFSEFGMVSPERQSFFQFLASLPSARQMVRAVLSVHDRSEPPNGPILARISHPYNSE